MSKVIETNDEGALYLPPEVLGATRPHSRYRVEVQGDGLILSPLEEPRPFWETAIPQERVEAFRHWVMSHVEGPNLPDEALRRESIYD